MGLLTSQSRLNFITARKSDLEYRLSTISMRSQNLATIRANAIAEKATAMQQYSAQAAAGETTVSFEQTQAYTDYEKAMAELDLADLNLTQQQSKVETELKALNAEKEEIGKLVDSNIKSSFGIFNK